MDRTKRNGAIALAVLAVVVGIVFASEVQLNHNEPRCRSWGPVNGCAEHGEPQPPPFLLPGSSIGLRN